MVHSLLSNEPVQHEIFNALNPDGAVTNVPRSLLKQGCYLYGVRIHNPNASDVFLQIFKKNASEVILGTTVNSLTFKVPNSGSISEQFENPYNFEEAFSFAVTTTEAGSTAPASAVSVTISYS